MGAGGASTDGLNLLPPVGSRFFSVGVGVVVVGDVVTSVGRVDGVVG